MYQRNDKRAEKRPRAVPITYLLQLSYGLFERKETALEGCRQGVSGGWRNDLPEDEF